jgi:hypothetical protein
MALVVKVTGFTRAAIHTGIKKLEGIQQGNAPALEQGDRCGSALALLPEVGQASVATPS